MDSDSLLGRVNDELRRIGMPIMTQQEFDAYLSEMAAEGLAIRMGEIGIQQAFEERDLIAELFGGRR